MDNDNFVAKVMIEHTLGLMRKVDLKNAVDLRKCVFDSDEMSVTLYNPDGQKVFYKGFYPQAVREIVRKAAVSISSSRVGLAPISELVKYRARLAKRN